MGSFIGIGDESIRKSLIETTRQYLVGNLERPQALEHVQDERIEIGLTAYEQPATEAPHKHSTATEYQYVLSGWTRYIDTVTGETHDFRQGDFFAILPDTSYAQKSKSGTRILFIKVPSTNDKQVEDATERLQEWLESPLQTVRRDYWHETDAPVANSIRPAVSVAVFDSSGRVLMLRRRDSGNWTLPGGTLEFDESLPDCAVREVREECGLDVAVTGVIGTYTDPDARVAYSDGEVRREFTVVLAGATSDTEVEMDAESTAFRWVGPSEAESLPLAASQHRRLEDAFAHASSGQTKLA